MDKNYVTPQADFPSPEVVQRAMFESGCNISDPDKEPKFPSLKEMKFASRMARWGADLELDACENWVEEQFGDNSGAKLRYHRRLGATDKDALRYLDEIENSLEFSGVGDHRVKIDLIRNLITSYSGGN